MGSVMMSSIKYKGMNQFDPIKGMPAGHMKNDQFFVSSSFLKWINVENQLFIETGFARGIIQISLVSRVFYWRSFQPEALGDS